MVAVDTNVIVRLLVRDDEQQAAAAERAVAGGAWLSVLGLAECAWVLASVYEFDRPRLIRAMEMLLDNDQLTIDQEAAVERALQSYRTSAKVQFTDCLMVELARAAGALPLVTFDRDLAKVPGGKMISS